MRIKKLATIGSLILAGALSVSTGYNFIQSSNYTTPEVNRIQELKTKLERKVPDLSGEEIIHLDKTRERYDSWKKEYEEMMQDSQIRESYIKSHNYGQKGALSILSLEVLSVGWFFYLVNK